MNMANIPEAPPRILRFGDYSDVNDATLRGNAASNAHDALNEYAKVIGQHPNNINFDAYMRHAEDVLTRKPLPGHTKPVNATETAIKNIGEALLETASRLDTPRAIAVLTLLQQHPQRLFRLSRPAVQYNLGCHLASSDATRPAGLQAVVDSVQMAFTQLENKQKLGKASPSTCEQLAGTLELIRQPEGLKPLIDHYPRSISEVEDVLQACVDQRFEQVDFASVSQRLNAAKLQERN